MRPLLVAQAGHTFRKTGATGTAGEQDMTADVVFDDLKRLKPEGWDLRCIDADEPDPMYAGDVFVAVHGDGSENTSVRGASVGYRTVEGFRLAQKWKAAYAAAGWPGGWRPDNYTANLSGYYGLINAVRDAGTEDAFIIEVGTMTNPQDRAWIDANHETIARTIWQAVAGNTVSEGVDEMKLLTPVPTGWNRVYRLWHPTFLHHYTTSIDEANALLKDPNWVFEDQAFDIAGSNTIPVYRVLRKNGKHFFTTSTKERDNEIALGGKDEGVAFFAANSGTAVIRFRNGEGHFYTINEAEGAGMVREGVAWYCGTVTPANVPTVPADYEELQKAAGDLMILKAKLRELAQ